MGLIEHELGQALAAPVKRKANATRQLQGSRRSQAKRVTSGTTEVMVKITGFGRGPGRVKTHLDYVSRNGKLELENERGEIFSGHDDVKGLFQEWKEDFCDERRHKNQRDTMHLVLSMPETTEADAVHRASRKFCKSTFGQNHEFVFALHTDEPHPHCHVTVKMRGFDGTRLNPRKDDLQAWRERFAEQLREQGVAAEATPRRARGVVRKAESSIVRHIERGDKTHEPRIPRVRALQVREFANELFAEAQGVSAPRRPWEEAIDARQRKIRGAWLAAAAALERADHPLKFNGMETRNERPDYKQIDPGRERFVQRAAALYQSHLEKAGSRSPPSAISGMRNMSSCSVVHDRNRTQVLLQSNAPHRLGQERTSHHEVRRERVSDPGVGGEARELKGSRDPISENKALAARMRAFVAAMPTIETQRQAKKRELAQQFSVRTDLRAGSKHAEENERVGPLRASLKVNEPGQEL
jgi:type IV secretory pathway VirD2 relaxase